MNISPAQLLAAVHAYNAERRNWHVHDMVGRAYAIRAGTYVFNKHRCDDYDAAKLYVECACWAIALKTLGIEVET